MPGTRELPLREDLSPLVVCSVLACRPLGSPQGGHVVPTLALIKKAFSVTAYGECQPPRQCSVPAGWPVPGSLEETALIAHVHTEARERTDDW